MGWTWSIQFDCFCDILPCSASYHDGGETVQECIDRARAEGWSISRNPSIQEPEIHYRCFCPKHHPHRGDRSS